MQVLSLGQEDPLRKAWQTHSSILAWEMLWPQEPSGLGSIGSDKLTACTLEPSCQCFCPDSANFR